MTANLAITDTELEAIRSVERALGGRILPPKLEPISGDVDVLTRLLERLAPAPPVEEVASRPNGNPTAGSPIGIVRDHPSHDEDEVSEARREILESLLKFSHCPDSLKKFVDDALKREAEDVHLLKAARDALNRYLVDDIPF